MNSVTRQVKQIIMRLLHSRFARSVAILASGTAAAQIATMAFAPFITRVYGPEAFGLLGTFVAITAVILPIAALGYPIAIVLPKDDRDALVLVRLSIFLSIGTSLTIAILLLFGGGWLSSTFGFESIANYAVFIPLTMLFATWMQIAQQWLIRKNQFSVVAQNAVNQSLILNTSKSFFGLLLPSASVLIAITAFGNALHAAMLYVGARKRYKTEMLETSESSVTSFRKMARSHIDFPLYRTPQILINAASQSLPVFMLSAFFGPVSAGYYTLANMVMGMPSNLVGKAVNDVFYSKIVEANQRDKSLFSDIVKATSILFAIGAVPFGLVALIGPWLFGAVFGASWTTAGEYARWLALFFLANLINKPAVAAVPVLGIQRGLLVYELLSTGSKAFALVVGFYWLESDLLAIALFSTIGFISYCSLISWILFHAKNIENHAKTG